MRSPGQLALVVVAIAAAVAGCGEEEKRFADARIVEKLNLEEVEGEKDYAMEEDLFCSVDRRLLNDRSEVEDALDADQIGLVVASREGNVGIIGVPIFASDCRETVRKKLNRLDPEPPD